MNSSLLLTLLPVLLAQGSGEGTTPLLKVPVRPVRLADDGGGRAAAIGPEQVGRWVGFANRVYAPAGIRLEYDPADGLAERRSTLLNNMTGTADGDWPRAKALGNEVAAGQAGGLTILFRHGPGAGPTGGGFGDVDYDFVALPGFEATTVCGAQNLGLLAHEVGHYLGLMHTFAAEFPDVSQAEARLRGRGGDLRAAFDGDGLADTPPDPFIVALQCGDTRSVRLLGRDVPIDRRNLMGYWDHPDARLSRQQAAVARWFLRRRLEHGMALPTNRAARRPIEAEALAIRERRGVEATGRHRLDLYLTLAPDFGRVQVWLDGRRLGPPIDAHAPRVVPSGRVELGTPTLTAGEHALGFEVVGKDRPSAGTNLGLDCIELVPVDGPG